MTVELGDHAWYFDGMISMDKNIPRAQWFPDSNPAVPTDYQEHGMEIFHYVFHDNDTILRGQPHMKHGKGSFAWLNNNPGNITKTNFDFGQYSGKLNWHNFLIFPDRQTGFDAIGLLLQSDFYVDLSILAAFSKYAPASDGNNPAQYAADVASAAGVFTSTTIRELDSSQLEMMQNKIESIEGSVEGDTLSYDSDDLDQAIKDLIA
ncbi:hypothetical protein [Nocardia sp. NBC_00403]|uniref:hypothetical protein n=1 Tax=Nocardia sp. NBC_00403 TaxID=2975990 RepID=UPI002E22FFF7